MRIALVDDDIAQLELLSNLIANELSSLGDLTHSITEYHSGEDFISDWHPDKFDLIILDIFMGKLTGVDVAYEIRKSDEHVNIAFCTSSNEFASESFEVGAKYYLRKPITAESVSKIFSRLNLGAIENMKHIKLPDGHSIRLRSILYTEYANHVVTIFLDNEKPHRLRTSQTEIETLLCKSGDFISPYKGITVNLYAIETLTDSSITLKNGETLPLTRRKVKEVKDAYKLFRYRILRNEVNC